MNYEVNVMFLTKLREGADSIAGKWNGDSSVGEDRATCANEISEKCTELIKLIEELKQL